jgi:hypothetical protein
MELTIVTFIQNGVVANSWAYNAEDNNAEDKFKRICKEVVDAQLSEEELDDCLDNGYCDSDNSNESVCISHTELLK